MNVIRHDHKRIQFDAWTQFRRLQPFFFYNSSETVHNHDARFVNLTEQAFA